MTAKTEAGALAIETARGDEYRAQLRAEGFRAGYAEAVERIAAAFEADPNPHARAFGQFVRSLPIPEDRT